VVAKLLLDDGDRGARYVVLRGLREDQHEAIEHVLTHHRLAVAAVPIGEHPAPRLLGWVTPDARAAFAVVCERGALLISDLAAALDWSGDRAREALEALALHRLVRTDGERYCPPPIG
jgi:hypothetical protein